MQASQIHSRNGNGSNAGVRVRSGASRARHPWYRRAMAALLLWKWPAAVDAPAPGRARAAAADGQRHSSPLRAAASAVARATCLREPLRSAGRPPAAVAHVDAVAPRMVTAAPKTPLTTLLAGEWGGAPWAYCGGLRLHGNILIRRLLLREDATRRRREMEVVVERCGRVWIPPPASRLSIMSLGADNDNNAQDDEDGEEDEGEGEEVEEAEEDDEEGVDDEEAGEEDGGEVEEDAEAKEDSSSSCSFTFWPQ